MYYLQIIHCTDDAELSVVLAVDEIADLIFQMDYSIPINKVTVADKQDLISSLTLYHLMIKVKTSMDQFADGLESVQLLGFMRKNPQTWESLFVYPNMGLSAGNTCMLMCIIRLSEVSTDVFYCGLDKIKQLFKVLYADDGSNVKPKQEDAFIHLSDFLDECYGKYIGFFLILITHE